MSSPADCWIIVLGRSTKLIGRMVPHTPEDKVPKNIVELMPCYELVDMKVPTREGIMNVVSVEPIAGLYDKAMVRLDRNDPSPTIMVDELSDSDQAAIRAHIKNCMALCEELRAERSGIALATPDQIPKGMKHS